MEEKGLSRSEDEEGEEEKEEDEEEDQGRSEEGEQARVPETVPIPKGPSALEREKHNLTHMPYRAWCRFCVRARGRNRQHRRLKGR